MSFEVNRRTFLKRTGQVGGFIATSGTLASLLASCGGNVSTTSPTPGTTRIESQGLKLPGALQWGASTDGGAPYIFRNPANPSQIVGFEFEIADAIAKLMGIRQKLIDTDYAQLEQALQANKFDVIMNGWEITEDRKKTELFSQPYYRYGQQIVVRSKDARFSSKTTDDTMSLTDLVHNQATFLGMRR